MYGSHGSPLGDPGGGFDPLAGGQGYAVVNAVAEVVPVRWAGGPLPVIVQNWPGLPPPLPGLKPEVGPPPLPWERRRPAPAPSAYGGKDMFKDLGLGGVTRLASAAGVAAGAVGLMAGSALLFKSQFLDPILGAAKGGFDRGYAHGSGTEVVGKSFEVLGAVFGTVLLPVTIHLATSALVLADNFARLSGAVNAEAQRRERESGWGDTWLERTALTALGVVTGNNKATARALSGTAQFFAGGTDKQRAGAMADVIQSLRESFAGTQANMYQLPDVRQQAQLAALQQDPLEARRRDLMLKVLELYVQETAGAIKTVADNTKPQPG